MKLYLAAPYAARDILKEEVSRWLDAGHEITSEWLNGTRPLGASTYGVSSASSDEEVYEHTRGDLRNIGAADVVIHYTANYLKALDPSLDDVTHNLHSGGRHVETGYALARGKDIVVMGPPENVFQRGLCYNAFDLDEALQILETVLAPTPRGA